jgi:hypothetical protein
MTALPLLTKSGNGYVTYTVPAVTGNNATPLKKCVAFWIPFWVRAF